MSRTTNAHRNGHTTGTALIAPPPRKKPWVFSFSAAFSLIFYVRIRGDRSKGCGRHFCRTIHAYADIGALLQDGLRWLANPAEAPDEDSADEWVKFVILMHFRRRFKYILWIDQDFNMTLLISFSSLPMTFELLLNGRILRQKPCWRWQTR